MPFSRPASRGTDRPAYRGTGRRPGPPERLWREALGDQIRATRQSRGQRIADVAERAGIAPQYLSEIERGRKDPSSEMLAAVAGALDVRLVDLTAATTRRLANAPSRGPLCLAA